MTPRGVQTNGEGKRTQAHLNLTRSLRDVWAEQFASEQPSHPSFVLRLTPRPPRLPYAGYDRTEHHK